MRRIGTKHARLGMVLTRPVFDNRGYLLIEAGTEMNREGMSILASRGSLAITLGVEVFGNGS